MLASRSRLANEPRLATLVGRQHVLAYALEMQGHRREGSSSIACGEGGENALMIREAGLALRELARALEDGRIAAHLHDGLRHEGITARLADAFMQCIVESPDEG